MELLVVIAIGYVLLKLFASIGKERIKQRKKEEKARQIELRAQQAAKQRVIKAEQRDLEALNRAVTPTTFFNRLSVCTLSSVEQVDLLSSFLDRYWLVCKEKSANAKTECAKRRALHAYFDNLRPYDPLFSLRERTHIQKYRNEFDSQYGEGIITEKKVG